MENLLDEFNYYLQHQQELVDKYEGKFIVIKNDSVLGAFDSELDAIRETTKTHELGTFLIQKCKPGKESYTQTYRSRVMLA